MARQGQFEKGNAGKPKGALNKTTKTVKETVLSVFNAIQSDHKVNLTAFAKKHPKEFYAIAAKLIPTEVKGTVEATLTWNETKTYEANKEAD